MVESTSDRRRHFRFVVEAILNFEILPAKHQPMTSRSVGDNGSGRFDLDIVLDSSSGNVRNLASCVKGLDRRIDYLHELLVSHTVRESGEVIDQVSLSSMGVAFHSSSPVAVDKKLRLNLLLVKCHTSLVTIGRVVRCDLDPSGDPKRPYVIALEFENISHAHQDLLMRYVLQQQAEGLSEKRDAPAR